MILEILCHETTEIIDQLLFSQTSPERDFLTHFHIIVVNIHVKNPQVTYNPLPQKPITPIPLCNKFCEDFQLDTREGFIKYIELGIKKMDGNYNNLLNRLASMSEKISDLYSATLEMEGDSGNAKAIHDYFIKRVADVTGIYESFVNQPDKYIHFVRLDKFLSEKGWDSIQFIDAQFESLAWCNGLPEPSQMYNDKAIERYNKYLFKHKNHSQSEEPKVEGSLWSKINKL